MIKKEADWFMSVEILSQLCVIHYPALVWDSIGFGRLCACSLLGFFIFLPYEDSRFKRFCSAKEVLEFLNRESLDAPPHLKEISQDIIEIRRGLSPDICPTKEDEEVLHPLIGKWKKIIAPIAV